MKNANEVAASQYDKVIAMITIKVRGHTLGSVARAMRIDRSRLSHQINGTEPFRPEIADALEDLLGVARGGLRR